MRQERPMRVVVVAGRHREARARTVDELLLAEPRAVAVHHDLGRVAEGVVHRMVRDRWGVVDGARVAAVPSCVSCTLREDLRLFLEGLAAQGEHPLCVVELADAVEPRAVAESISAWEGEEDARGRIHLAAVCTAVEAGLLATDLAGDAAPRGRSPWTASRGEGDTVAEVVARQVEYPTLLTLTAPRGGHALWEQGRALLEHLNPAALVLPPVGERLLRATRGRFSPRTAAARLDPACAQYPASRRTGRVSTMTWRRRRPLHPERLHAALERLAEAAPRSRGRFWLAGRLDTLLTWEAAGGALAIGAAGPWLAALPDTAWALVSAQRRMSARVDWHPVIGDRGQCLSFTGVDLDAGRIAEVLDSCLLTDEEMGDPGHTRPAAHDPFAEVLGGVR
ncbi:GTPase, G3E family [Marinactinospora thermotolerans DSM 45154]|uniref:GTPase, G3E family n=1 Tax=Marinactinospora thermotolerans DSM 45154 TaxID=1122192 RepID=A0A1T4NKM5_9ACTN|nr:GTP-binding protein [Marinactinospora thermotolerans]SJZ79819.1 GTPase, G3E family [Marinactinospora thermotolerans DSM 45154]